MASIIRTSLAMGWDGDEAIAGLNKLADATQKTGQEIDQLAIKQRQAMAEQKAFEKRLESMNALERQQAVLARETKQRRMGMSAEAIKKEDTVNALKEKMRGMNALEREQFKAAEREKKMLMSMSAPQIRAYQEAQAKKKEQAAADESRKKQLAGMNALEREKFLADEKTKARRMNMTAAQIRAEMEAEKKAEASKREAEKKSADKAAAAEEWRKKSTFQKLASMTSGAADIRAAGGMMLGVAGGIANGAVQFAQMGAELESMQIRAAYLAGSFAKGTKAIEDMRQASMASGVALKENIAAMSGLANAGISMETATKTVMQVQGAAELLGEQGAATISSSIAGMFKAGVAASGELDALQSQGIPVYQSLITVLEKTTGKAHTLEEAMAAVREGSVTSAEGIRAVMIATNGKDMQDAVARFAGSFEGQVRRLKTTMEDTFREISKMFLDSFDITSIAAGLRGAFMAIRDIVKEISDIFIPVIDPKDKGAGIENTFKAVRNLTYDVMERLAKGISEMRTTVEVLWIQITNYVDKTLNQLRYGLTADASALEDYNRMSDRLAETKIGKVRGAGAEREAGIGNFFGNLKAKADARDAANLAKPQQAVADAHKNAANGADKATLAFETMAKSTNKFATDTLAQMRTPFEMFEKETLALSKSAAEAKESLMGGTITQAEFAKFREAANRKGGKLLQDLIANNIGGESQFSSASVRGSAADVEMRVRAQYGEETMSIQEKIRIATERAAFNSDKQLAYSDALVKAFERTKAPPVAALGK